MATGSREERELKPLNPGGLIAEVGDVDTELVEAAARDGL